MVSYTDCGLYESDFKMIDTVGSMLLCTYIYVSLEIYIGIQKDYKQERDYPYALNNLS